MGFQGLWTNTQPPFPVVQEVGVGITLGEHAVSKSVYFLDVKCPVDHTTVPRTRRDQLPMYGHTILCHFHTILLTKWREYNLQVGHSVGTSILNLLYCGLVCVLLIVVVVAVVVVGNTAAKQHCQIDNQCTRQTRNIMQVNSAKDVNTSNTRRINLVILVRRTENTVANCSCVLTCRRRSSSLSRWCNIICQP